MDSDDGGGGLEKRETRNGRGWEEVEAGASKGERWGGEKRLRLVRASLASSHGKQFLNVTLSLAAGIGCTPRTALCKGAYAAGRGTKRTVRNPRDERQEISEPREGKWQRILLLHPLFFLFLLSSRPESSRTKSHALSRPTSLFPLSNDNIIVVVVRYLVVFLSFFLSFSSSPFPSRFLNLGFKFNFISVDHKIENGDIFTRSLSQREALSVYSSYFSRPKNIGADKSLDSTPLSGSPFVPGMERCSVKFRG